MSQLVPSELDRVLDRLSRVLTVEGDAYQRLVESARETRAQRRDATEVFYVEGYVQALTDIARGVGPTVFGNPIAAAAAAWDRRSP